MRKLYSLAVVALLSGSSAMTLSGSDARSRSASIQEQLVGGWRLAWLERPGADGKIHRADCTELLVYTRDGHMSVQVMERNPPAPSSGGPEQYSQGGYEASFGRYEIDESTHTFNFRVEGALVRTLIGQDLKRAFELSGNQLIVKSTNPEEHWRVAWERY